MRAPPPPLPPRRRAAKTATESTMTAIKKTIVLLPGDGIGPEVTRAAASVLAECELEFGHRFELQEQLLGGAAIDATGEPLPGSTLEACRAADAVFLGAV